jgi:hypothetical protein
VGEGLRGGFITLLALLICTFEGEYYSKSQLHTIVNRYRINEYNILSPI